MRIGVFGGAGRTSVTPDSRRPCIAAVGLGSSGVWGTLDVVRHTEFWDRMARQFGPGYAESVARDHVLSVLGGVTVEAALARGDDVKGVWRAVCEEFGVPSRER